MHIIEKRSAESSTSYIGGSNVKIAMVDGMAEVQSLDKPDLIKTWQSTSSPVFSSSTITRSRSV